VAFAKLDIKGGIVKDRPDYSSGPVWIDGDKVRFQQGLPEKLGGWKSETGYTFTGIPSKAITWRSLSGTDLLAVGTDKKLQLIFGDVLYDITPIAATTTPTNPYTTVDEDATVTVTEAAHGAEVGDFVLLSSVTAVGGITPDGEVEITTVPTANTWTFEHTGPATSSVASGGGSPTHKYLLGTGSPTSTKSLGWGTGAWSDPREGFPSTTATANAVSDADPGQVTTTANHGFTTGDQIKHTNFAGMIELNGVTHTITVTAVTTYTLGIDTEPFASYSSAGTATKQFGWGTALGASAVNLEPAHWSFDLWGEDLIATRRGGLTYLWDASNGAYTRAVLLHANVPATAAFSIVGVPERQVVTFGGADPLLVQWSDEKDYTLWTAAATNTAGALRLDKGTKIIAAVPTRDQTIILTDEAAFGMNFQGPPFTYGFRMLSTGCGPVSQNGAIDVNGVVFWMGCGHFYVFDGAVRILPSPVRDHVFDNLNMEKQNLAFTGLNRQFSEIWWFYPTVGNTYPDSYVIFNYSSNEWSTGTIERTAWLDQSEYSNYPLALNSSGTLYYHENGVDDDTTAMTSYVESGVFEIPGGNTEGPGESLLLMDKLIPDATITGTVDLSIYTRKYPHTSETTKGPFVITSSTGKVSLRAKGRQMRMKISSDALSDTWKWGISRINQRSSSKR
tara:strand:- start:2540 stop:4564 length:2025 start_codon:yes stop_codon:yes gene_type:complete